MNSIDNSYDYKNVIDCNVWFGNDMFNNELNIQVNDLQAHASVLGKKVKEVMVFLTNFYSLKYDPIEGDLETENILRSGNGKFAGNLVFPGSFIYRKNSFEKYLKEKFKSGFKILRFFPKYHKYSIDCWACRYFFEVLNEHSFPVMINIEELDVTGNKEIRWETFYEIASNFKNIPLIIEGGNSKEMMFTGYLSQLMQECENIFLTAHNLLAFDQIEYICERFSSSRLLFDSYFPFYQESMVFGRIKDARVSSADKRKILGENLLKISKNIIF